MSMKVLVADDSETARRTLAALVKKLGLDAEVVEVADGTQALAALLAPDGPQLALLAWELPGLDGVAVCRQVRAAHLRVRPHLVLVTGRESRDDTVEALRAGADDYLTTPPHAGELMARLQVGLRNLDLQRELLARVTQVESAVRQLDAASLVLAAAPRVAPTLEVVRRQGRLGPPLDGVPAVQTLAETLARLLAGMGVDGTAQKGTGLWAHGALGLPHLGTWLDVVLEADRATARRMLKAVHGREPKGDAELLDTVGDVLALVLADLARGLDAAESRCLRPFAPRAWPGSSSVPRTPEVLELVGPGLVLTLLPTASPVKTTTFAALEPGQVLLQALHPPSMPTVEVLARGCLLKPVVLKRARPFFKGADTAMTLEVMAASAFSATARE